MSQTAGEDVEEEIRGGESDRRALAGRVSLKETRAVDKSR